MKEEIKLNADDLVSISIYHVNEYPMHYHEEPELIFILSGTATLHTAFYTIESVPENEFLFINSTTLHNIERCGDEPCQVMSVYFHMSKMAALYNVPAFSVLSIASFDKFNSPQIISRLRDTLVKMACARYLPESMFQTPSDLAMECYAYMMNNFQWHYYEDYVLHNYPQRLPLSQITRTEQVLGYIQEHQKEKLTLSSVAETFYLSKYYLSHLFKKSIGISFQDLLNAVRLNTALYSLLGTQQSIEEISAECGFSSPAYFRKAFATHAKTSLSSYRKKYSKRTLQKMRPDITPLSETEQKTAFLSYQKKYYPDQLLPQGIEKIPVHVKLTAPPLSFQLPESLYQLDLTPCSLIHPDFAEDIVKSMRFRSMHAHKDDFLPLYHSYGSWRFTNEIQRLANQNGVLFSVDDTKAQAASDARLGFGEMIAAIIGAADHENPVCCRGTIIGGPNAMYTDNGFRTGWYYLYYLLHQLKNTVIFSNDCCLVTMENCEICILCFNEGEARKEIFLHLEDIVCNYSILTYSMALNGDTEEGMWHSLGAPNPAPDALLDTIRHSCFPHVSYTRSTAQYDLFRDITVEPGEIKLLTLMPLESA